MREIEEPRDGDEGSRPAGLAEPAHELEGGALVLAAREPNEALEVASERAKVVALIAEALRLAREALGDLEPATDRLLLGEDEDVLQSAEADVASLGDVGPAAGVDRESERAPRETTESAL